MYMHITKICFVDRTRRLVRKPTKYVHADLIAYALNMEQGQDAESPRQWYKRFDTFVVSNGYTRSSYDNCVYFKRESSEC